MRGKRAGDLLMRQRRLGFSRPQLVAEVEPDPLGRGQCAGEPVL